MDLNGDLHNLLSEKSVVIENRLISNYQLINKLY